MTKNLRIYLRHSYNNRSLKFELAQHRCGSGKLWREIRELVHAALGIDQDARHLNSVEDELADHAKHGPGQHFFGKQRDHQ